MPFQNRKKHRDAAEERESLMFLAKQLEDAEKHPERTERGTLLPGNTIRLQYPRKVAEKLFERMYNKLIQDEATGEPNYDNPVRANTIKLVKEIALCVGINYQIYRHLKKNYGTHKDIRGDINPNYSETLVSYAKKIEEICEMRLIYSGQFMDIFVLKNHFGYVDKKDINITSGDVPQTFFTLPDGTKLPI